MHKSWQRRSNGSSSLNANAFPPDPVLMSAHRDVLCLHPPPCWVRPRWSPVSVTQEGMLLPHFYLSLMSDLAGLYHLLFLFSASTYLHTPLLLLHRRSSPQLTPLPRA